jgi:ATP-dependent DNA helicase RecG
MFETAIREGKLPPDFGRSDSHSVVVTLSGQVQDEAFLVFLDRIGRETQILPQVEDLVVLDAVRRGIQIPAILRDRIEPLLEMGAVERVSRNKVILARRFYALKGRPGEYTRRRGLDRNTRKELLFKHIESGPSKGVGFDELAQVLPDASRNDIKVLLREMKTSRRIHVRGATKAARWFPGPPIAEG